MKFRRPRKGNGDICIRSSQARGGGETDRISCRGGLCRCERWRMKAKRDTEGNQKLWRHDGCMLELKITSVLEWVPRARKKCIHQCDRIPIGRSDSVSIPNRRPGQGIPSEAVPSKADGCCRIPRSQSLSWR